MSAGRGVHHIALAVSDLERARRFYADVLGLAPIERPDMTVAGAWFDAGATQLHLIVNADAATLRGTRSIDSHDGHFALRIASYEEMVARLEAHDIEHRARPVSGVPWRRIFVTDPDGNMIELVDDASRGA